MFFGLRSIGRGLVKFVRNLLLFLKVTMLSVYIVYLIYAASTGRGVPWANGVLIILTVAYLLFYIFNHNRIDKSSRAAKRVTKRVYAACKIFINGLTLGITVYGLYSSAGNPSFWSVFLTVIMIIGWTVSLLTEIIYNIILKSCSVIVESAKADIDNAKHRLKRLGIGSKKDYYFEPYDTDE